MTKPDSPLRFWLGQRVAVVVDRPLGSCHAVHAGLRYPVNYGYVPNTEAGDQEPIDVYILGVSVPVTSFIGEVVAIVVRFNDVEDKLVAAPAGMRFSKDEVRDAIRFQEQFYETTLIVAGDA